MTMRCSVVDTDTESSVPSTRQNSMLFPISRTTSMTSVLTDFSIPSGDASRKRSLENQDDPLSNSAPTTPPKMRRTTDGSQVRKGLPISLPRALTFPIQTTQRVYPDLPKDEESVFRPSVQSATTMPPQAEPIASSSKVPISPSAQHKGSRGTQDRTKATSEVVSSDDPTPDFSFLNHSEGSDLPLSIIAHDRDVQRLMDAKRISWGVQWEIARGITRHLWKWSDVTPGKLDLLRGSNAEAASKVVHVMKTGEAPSALPANLELW